MEIYHLNASKRNSQRCVKVEALDDITVNENLANASKTMNEQSTMVELRKAELRAGVKMFIREVSEPTDNPLKEGLKWTKVNVLTFEEGLSQFFTPKDIQILEAIYRDYHEITKSELDAILGKGLSLSND